MSGYPVIDPIGDRLRAPTCRIWSYGRCVRGPTSRFITTPGYGYVLDPTPSRSPTPRGSLVRRTRSLATDFSAIEQSRIFESGRIRGGTIKKGNAEEGNIWRCEKSRHSPAWWLLQ
jgi:hypothetical protein